jgi:hypothetical protein
MNPVDLGQVAAALQGPTFRPLELPKLEALLSEVLDKLTAVEVASGAYSKAAVHMLLKINGSAEQQQGSGKAGSRIRRVVLGSSSNGSRNVAEVSVSGQHGFGAAAVLSGVGNGAHTVPAAAAAAGPLEASSSGGSIRSSSSNEVSSSSTNSSSLEAGIRQAEEVAQLKEYLVQQSVMEGSSSLDDVPDLQWGSDSEPC